MAQRRISQRSLSDEGFVDDSEEEESTQAPEAKEAKEAEQEPTEEGEEDSEEQTEPLTPSLVGKKLCLALNYSSGNLKRNKY